MQRSTSAGCNALQSKYTRKNWTRVRLLGANVAEDESAAGSTESVFLLSPPPSSPALALPPPSSYDEHGGGVLQSIRFSRVPLLVRHLLEPFLATELGMMPPRNVGSGASSFVFLGQDVVFSLYYFTCRKYQTHIYI